MQIDGFTSAGVNGSTLAGYAKAVLEQLRTKFARGQTKWMTMCAFFDPHIDHTTYSAVPCWYRVNEKRAIYEEIETLLAGYVGPAAAEDVPEPSSTE